MARKDIHTQQQLELRRLRGLPTQQTLAVTRAAAASRLPRTAKMGSHTSCRPRAAAAVRPPRTTKISSHSSCGRFAASAHNKLLNCCHMSCDRFAAYAQNKLSPSHELRPLRSLRAQQALAVTRAATASRLPHTTNSCCHTSCGRFAASAHNKALDVTRAAAALRPPHTTSS